LQLRGKWQLKQESQDGLNTLHRTLAKRFFNPGSKRTVASDKEETDLLQRIKLHFDKYGESRYVSFDGNFCVDNLYGYHDKESNPDGQQTFVYYMFPSVFKELFCANNNKLYERNCAILLKYNVLEPSDEKGRFTVRRRIAKRGIERLLMFKASKLTGIS